MKHLSTIVIIGIVLRLILMPMSLHPDLRGHYLGAYFITQGDILGVYDHLSRLPRTDKLVQLYQDNFLVYPPLTYLTHAVWLKFIAPFVPWNLFSLLETDIGQAMRDPSLPWLIFLLKLPYLFADLGFLYILLKIFNTKDQNRTAILWALNLPLIYSAYLMGQFDVFVVVFISLALYQVLVKSHPHLAAICIGLAAGFKPVALVLSPFLPGNVWKNVGLTALTYLIIILPYLPSAGFRMYALVAEHSDKIWYAKVLVSGSQYLPLFFVGLVLLFWLRHFNYQLLPKWLWLTAPLLLFYSVVHYHPQWFAWVTPLLIVGFLLSPKTRILLGFMLACHVLIILSFDSSLNFGLFGINFALPISDQLVSGVRGVLAATSLSYLTMSRS